MTTYDIIIRPILTEKGYSGISEMKYAFVVAKSANKTQIKEAVEKIFGVDVARVNIANYDGKVTRAGRQTEGKTVGYKKAYVFLKSDSKPIQFFESLS
ncbi:MAG: 50S ribosomal protein L23 [Clostridia bacterium]|nr:50S ribosomal protein L23 [Clostridia bacterium]